MRTTLYVKTHNITGLKYFGKTTKRDPQKYIGSGKYWKAHIKKHGYNVKTDIIGTFDDINECREFAINFSKENNIVESNDWANLIIENGIDGAPNGHIGHKFTIQQLKKMSDSSTKRWEDEEYKTKMCKLRKESWTEERKLNQSIRLKGIKRPEHAEKLKGRKYSKEHCEKLRKPKHSNFGKLVSKALKGKPKSEEHKQKLRKPKVRVCRLIDKKEMSINHYTRWLNSLIAD